MATEASPDAGTTPGRPAGRDQRYEFARSSRDLLRLVGGLILLLVGLVLATVLRDALLGFETDLTRAVRGLPEGLAVIVLGTIRALSVLAALGLVAWLAWRRQWMLLGRLLLASVVAAALLALVDRLIGPAPAPSLLAETPPAWATDISTSLGSWNVAIAVAIYLVARPLLTVPYRRLAVGVITLNAVHVLLAGSELPRDILAAIACGFLAASSVLLALGRPMRPLDPDQVAAALRRTAIDVSEVHPASVDARGSRPFFGTTAGGGGLFVKVLGREERSSDLLFRFYRWLRFRGLGDEAIASSLKQSIEHEALVSALAAADGIRTPRLLGVAEIDADRLALAFVRINGSSLDGVPAERLTDEVLRGIWRLVADLHRAGIAHRDLRLANLFLDDNGQAWLIDFGFGTVAALPQQLAGDVAELLCSMAVAVGPRRAVDAAVAELRPEQIQAALPRLQPDALSSATRKAMKAHKGLDKQLQETAAAAVGVEKIKLQHLERVQPRQLLTLVATALAAYLLIHQITQIKRPAGRPRPGRLELGEPGPGRLGPDLCRRRGEPDRRLCPASVALADDGGPARGVVHQPHQPGEGRRHGRQRPLPPEAGARSGHRDRRDGTHHPGGGDHAHRPDRRVPGVGRLQDQRRQAAIQQHHPAGPGHRGRDHRPGGGDPTGPAADPHRGRPAGGEGRA